MARNRKDSANADKHFYNNWWFWVILAFIVFMILVSIPSGGSDSTSDQTEAVSSKTEQISKEDAAKDEDVPREYKNALKKAKSYSDNLYMSKQGIYDQLTSEYGNNFPAEAAQYAVDNLKTDYNRNALKKAESYSKNMSMSTNEIYEQLTSPYGEKFTPEEAQYAIDHLNQ